MSPTRPLAPSEYKKFMSLEELALVESLVSQLSHIIQAEHPSYKHDALGQPKALASLVLQLQLFMDQALGEKVPREARFMTKLPAACFRDFAHPNGALKHILVWSLEYRQLHQPEGRRFDLLSDKNREFTRGLCQLLSRRLKEEGLWQPPKVCFWEHDGFQFTDLPKLKQIVVKHDGHLAASISEATHIVLPKSVIDPDDKQQYFRTIELRGNKLFAHWWYLPDSYDAWIDATSDHDVSVEETIIPSDGKWKLSVDWLNLLDEFNEWMNESDFEIEKLPGSLIDACGDLCRIQQEQEQQPMSKSLLRVRENGTVPTTERTHSGSRRGRPPALEIKASENSSPRFRLRLGPSIGTADVDAPHQSTPAVTEMVVDSLSQSQRRKRARVSSAESVVSQRHPEAPINKTATAPEEAQHGSKRSKLSHTMTTAEVDEGLVPSTATPAGVAPGTFVLHLTAPGSVRGSYDTIRACHLTSTSPGLKSAVAASAERCSAMSTEQMVELMSEIDSDSEDTARVFLAAMRHQRRGEVDLKSFPSTSSAVSRSGRKRKSQGSVPPSSPKMGSATSSSSYHRRTEPSHPVTRTDEEMLIPSSAATLRGQRDSMEMHPTVIAPGVTKFPPRSLQQSIITAPKDSFSVLRNVCPLDWESGTPSIQNVDSKLEQHLARAEATTRAMMAMWSVALQLESESQSLLFPLTGDEPGDVPPIEDPTPSELPLWLTSSNQHLSDFERQAIEYQQSKTLSRDVEMTTHSMDSPQPQAPLYGSQAQTVIPPVLPSQTFRWFNMDSVHPVEREQLKTFFFGYDENEAKQCERQYHEIRNVIIRRYRLNPRRYLSFTDCRKFIDGDSALLLKIHSFLDFWGLINFQALPHTFPTRTRRAKTFSLPQNVPSWVRDQLLTSPAPTQPVTHQSSAHCIICKRLCLYSYFVLKPSHVPGVSNRLIQQGVWCVRCFANGKYPETLSQRQFRKVVIPLAGTHTGEPNEWTEKEVHKLIEGIEKFGENWDSVASHVGSGRTPADCVTQFIRLPIEEETRGAHSKSEVVSTGSGAGTAAGRHGVVAASVRTPSPFRDSPNPLLTQINFIDSLMGPEFAAVSARAAAEALLEQSTQELGGESAMKSEGLSTSSVGSAGDTKAKVPHGEEDGCRSTTTTTIVASDNKDNLDRPLTSSDIERASKKVIEMAAQFAAVKAKDEEKKIRALMRQLNDLKEREVETKIREFYKNERLIENANKETTAKLAQYVKARDALWSRLAKATEENQKVLLQFQKQQLEGEQLNASSRFTGQNGCRLTL